MEQKKTITDYYNGNKNLKAHGVQVEYTREQLDEYIKCSSDPIYFIKKYVKIVHVDRGVVPFSLYPFQERVINAYMENRKVICRIGRQQGKTQTTAAYFLWFILFNSDKLVAIMANKAAVAREILSRIQFAYENLPFWIQSGVKEWNKGSVKLSNGSGIITAATSANAIRGFSAAAVYIDETAFIHNNIFEELLTSVFPTISSGKETKIFLSSTPKGLNHFAKLWFDAVAGTNGFVPVQATWDENPDRDEAWLKDQRESLGELKFNQEVLCVGPDTTVTIRINSEVMDIKISDLYEFMDTGIEILTPTGFQNFDSIVRKTSNDTMRIGFADGTDIVCTRDHRFISDSIEIVAETIKEGHSICGKIVTSITYSDDEIFVYDPVNVSGGNLYMSNGLTSHNCEFLGSSKTLLNGTTLANMIKHSPIHTKDSLSIYTEPIKGHSYVTVADTSRGQHLDYSAFVIIDITALPYAVVATYKNNQISPMSYPFLIMKASESYNMAHILVEINDIGGQIADTLFYEYEYENIYFTYKDELNEGRGYPGIRTTKKVKSIGCSNLKDLIESEQLLPVSGQIAEELGVFSQKGASYAAEDEKINDDLTTCLWLFGWLTKQPIFKDLTNVNIRKIISQKTEEHISENMTSFGFITDGLEEYENSTELDTEKYPTMDDWIFS